MKPTGASLFLAENPWFKVFSNVFVMSLILLIISLFSKSWKPARWLLLGVVVISAIVIFIIIKIIQKDLYGNTKPTV